MQAAMKELLSSHINGKKVLLLFVLTNVVYVYMLAVSIPGVMQFAGDLPLLDMMPTGYDFAYVETLFAALGEAGRSAYLFRQIPVDMVYPGLFGISYCLVFAYFLNRIGQLKSPMMYFCLLPIIAAVADYAENVGIITLLNSFPGLSPGWVSATNLFSILKSSATTVYFVGLILLLITFGLQSLRRKRASDTP